MNGRSVLSAIAVALGASALGVGVWTGATYAAMATILPLHLDVSWIHGTAWALALASALAAVALVAPPASSAKRGALGLLGVATLGGIGWTAATVYAPDGWSIAVLAIGGLGALAALVLAARPWPSAPAGRPRAGALALALALALGWGQGILLDMVEEHRAQVLPPRALELRAAYPYAVEPIAERIEGDDGIAIVLPATMPSVVVDAEGRVGDVIALGGERWNVHASDALRLAREDVHRVRWLDAGEVFGVTIRVGGVTRLALDERARRRSSQYDALYADGEPLALVFHAGLEPGRLVLMDADRRALHRVYRVLTRP